MRSLGLRTNVYVGKTGLCARGDLWTPQAPPEADRERER